MPRRGHSFGGHVALEYALRYPASPSHLVLPDTGGDAHWARQNAPDVLARRNRCQRRHGGWTNHRTLPDLPLKA
jgi:pimeloyl-ACP methyl ester carboxylesterase